MTHRRTRTLIQAVLAVMIVAMALVAAPTPAKAANPWDQRISLLKNKGTVTIYVGTYSRGFSCDTRKVSGLRSSNEKVVSVSKRKGIDDSGAKVDKITFLARKPGRAKVSFSYKGKRRTVNVVVKKKYVSPVASFKIGGTDIAKNLKSGWARGVPKMNCAGKTLSIKPKKGWKVKKIYASIDLGPNRVAGGKRMKNGGKLPKNSVGTITVSFARPSNNGYIVLDIHIPRP